MQLKPATLPGNMAPKAATLAGVSSSSTTGLSISITQCLACHGLGSNAPVVINNGTIQKTTPGEALTGCKPGETLYYSTVQGAKRPCTGHGQFERY